MARGAVTVGTTTVGTPERRARQTRWLGDSKNRLRSFPEEVREDIGAAIYWAQLGDKHPDAKPLAGFGGAGVLEIVENHDGDTYRAVYTVRFTDWLYILHCFQKKSKKRDETPKQDMNLIKERLKKAVEIEAAKTSKGEK